MPLTPEQIEAIEEENEIAAVLEWEEEMQEAGVQFVSPMPADGEETDERKDILR